MINGGIIRIKLVSFDPETIEKSVNEILTIARRSGSRVSGPVPLPTKIKRFTIQRSTFTDKKSREQFEIRWHARLVDILDPNPTTIDQLGSIELPSGVDVKIEVL